MKFVRNIILAFVYTPKKKAPYVSFLFSFSILRFGPFDP